jgi:DNA repair photolyase
MDLRPPGPSRGRGAALNPTGRFERLDVELDAEHADPLPESVKTEYFRDTTRSVITRNDSPDVGFECSLNPYRGCEHGCVYCYARPTHEYLGLSLGLDFESRIFVKQNAPELLRHELSRPQWKPETLVLSGVTDPYQPVERTLGITRACLQLLSECRQPVSIISKSSLVTRDIDLLRELARHDAVSVALSVTTLDEPLRRALEPRAASAERRLDAIARLNQAGIPAGVMVAPVIPGLNDHEIPAVLARAAEAGARFAGYVLLRLPHGVKDLFERWLDVHYPSRKQRVLSRIRDLRGGALNDPRFNSRMRGEGPTAQFLADLFRKARMRAGIPARGVELNGQAFRRPGAQPSLFDTDR